MSLETSSTYTYVADAAGLDALVGRLGCAKRVALDIEANSLYRYFLRVCLIQITFDGESAVIDPLVGLDLTGLIAALSDKDLILHGGDYDLRMMRASLGFQPHGTVFDTMLAAQIVGCEQLGLVALAEHYLGVKLSKRNQKSNWAHRPLEQSQLDYAADDTRYLAAIEKLLVAEMEALDRLEWHREMCERMVQSAAYGEVPESDPTDAWRVKGSAFLEPQQLAFVRQIWHWREEEARKADRPPFKILGNPELLSLADWAIANPEASIVDWRHLPRHCTGRRLEALKSAVARAKGLPRAEWPERFRPRRSTAPEPDRRLEIETLQATCAGLAEELGVPSSLLAPRTTLVAIARSDAETAEEIAQAGSLMAWQARLLAEPFQQALDEMRTKRQKPRRNGRRHT